MGRDRFLNLLAVLGSLIIALLGVEVGVRVFADDGMQFDLEMWKYTRLAKDVSANPRLGHEHKPNVSAHLMGVDISVNAQKLRGNGVSLERVPGKARIMMLGDSITFGWGVPFEETFPRRLERMLDADGIKSEVINAGVGNYNTIMEVEYFLNEGRRYRPDVVVLNYFINDAEPVPVYGNNGWLARNSYAYAYLSSRLDVLNRQLSRRQDWGAYYAGLYEGDAPGWRAAAGRIDALAEYCRRNDIKLLIVNIPELRDLKNYRFTRVQNLLREAAKRNQVPYLDLLGSVRGIDETKLWVSRPDPHPNGYANELFAKAMFPKIRKLLLPGN